MKKWKFLAWIVFILLFTCPGQTRSLAAKPVSTDIPNQPYFGQDPPGETPALFAPGIISTGAHELAVTISPDLKEFYVSRSSFNYATSIVCFKQSASGWSGPQLAPFIQGLGDVYPFYSPVENAIYFNSMRPLPGTAADKPLRTIWVTRRSGANWTAAKILSEQLDLSVHVAYPSVAKNGNIYFNSTLSDTQGGSDIYLLEKKGSGYGKISNLGSAVNTEHQEFHPFISPDEDYIIFDANRPEGFGGNDLYISFKEADGSWSKAVNMGEKINSNSSDMRAYVSPEVKYIFFCSMRENYQDKLDEAHPSYESFSRIIYGPGNGSQDIYWVSAAIIDRLKNSRTSK